MSITKSNIARKLWEASNVTVRMNRSRKDLLIKNNAAANIPKWDASENIIFNLKGIGDTLALAYLDQSTLLLSKVIETLQIVRKLRKIQKTKFSLL